MNSGDGSVRELPTDRELLVQQTQASGNFVVPKMAPGFGETQTRHDLVGASRGDAPMMKTVSTGSTAGTGTA